MDQFGLSNYLIVTKIFTFEMAHALYKHEGACRNMHGHSYRLHVSITGKPKQQPGAADDGMLMDFSALKNLVKEKILADFDHAMVVNSSADYNKDLQKLPFAKVHSLPFQPTCENLILHFARLLVSGLPEGVKLQRLKLYETASSYAEWHA